MATNETRKPSLPLTVGRVRTTAWDDVYELRDAHNASLDAEEARWVAAVVAAHGPMREALEALTDRADRIGGDGYGMIECPWCGAQDSVGREENWHEADCELVQARAALALAQKVTP